MRVALTIAGSDSGGGAGIQADLRTFGAHGVFGTCALTAVTAQNTVGVRGVWVPPPESVAGQIDAVVEDFDVAAVKIGMLATASVASAVAEALTRHGLPNVVLDTVMVAKGGDRLLDDAAVSILRDRLLPVARVVTPNVPEAEVLTGHRIRDLADLRDAAHALVSSGARAALVKGGHLDGPPVDVLCDAGRLVEFSGERIPGRHTHGTGCTLSSAIAARLALGGELEDAVRSAKAYVEAAIRLAPGLGRGHGPLGVPTDY